MRKFCHLVLRQMRSILDIHPHDIVQLEREIQQQQQQLIEIMTALEQLQYL